MTLTKEEKEKWLIQSPNQDLGMQFENVQNEFDRDSYPKDKENLEFSTSQYQNESLQYKSGKTSRKVSLDMDHYLKEYSSRKSKNQMIQKTEHPFDENQEFL